MFVLRPVPKKKKKVYNRNLLLAPQWQSLVNIYPPHSYRNELNWKNMVMATQPKYIELNLCVGQQMLNLHLFWGHSIKERRLSVLVVCHLCGLNNFESNLMNAKLEPLESTLLSTGVGLMRNIAGPGCSPHPHQCSQMPSDTQQENMSKNESKLWDPKPPHCVLYSR